MTSVRSYRRARTDANRMRLGRSVLTFTTSQGAFAVAGLFAGLLVGGAVGSPLAVAVAGMLGGAFLGSLRRDGRDPARWLLASATARRSAWSPRWGRLTVRARVVRWTATARGAL